ncbi:hypothetical protein NFI96_031464 [Prochilodus magdalenae]|nr:hypothetical protein NFI96_031464 [Prochilodus magdalenae]
MNGDKHLNRRFSLDSLGYSPDSGGLLGKAKSCKMRRSADGTKGRGLDEAHLELLDINRGLHRSSSTRTTTIEEEGMERLDGQINRNSFKSHNKTFQKHFPEISKAEELICVFTCAIQIVHYTCFTPYVVHNTPPVPRQDVRVSEACVLPLVGSTEGDQGRDSRFHDRGCKEEEHSTSRTQRYRHPHQQWREDPHLSVLQYLFVSLRNRDGCFQHLQSICPQLQTVSANGSRLMSSAENGHELDGDTISSHSSQEDSMEHRRVSFTEQDKSLGTLASLPITDIANGQAISSSTPRSSISRDGLSTEEEETAAVSWVTMVTEKIKSALSVSRTFNINKLLVVYLVLVALLLLTSGYIGLRIVALEEQLNMLGAMSEFSLQRDQPAMIEACGQKAVCHIIISSTWSAPGSQFIRPILEATVRSCWVLMGSGSD